MIMKRASYREAIAWIAHNDNAGNDDSEEDVAGYVTVGLVADLFGKTDAEVAAAVMRIRRKLPAG
jgi:fructose-1,6-bisphosphatase